MTLEKIDYIEPRCICDKDMYLKNPPVHPIPISRIISKMDELYSSNDIEGAGKIAEYWIKEAMAVNDLRGEFTLQNELMGINRKLGNEVKAIEAANKALSLSALLENGDSPDGATAYINIATVYKAFDQAETALPLFEHAKIVYEKYLDENDERLGGLYNNMALALSDLERYDEAEEMFLKAIKIMSEIPGNEGDQAISFLNIASCLEAKKGLEEAEESISNCIKLAWQLLNTDGIAEDGNYAYICEKCASVFEYYGYFIYAEELIERSKLIYERA